MDWKSKKQVRPGVELQDERNHRSAAVSAACRQDAGDTYPLWEWLPAAMGEVHAEDAPQAQSRRLLGYGLPSIFCSEPGTRVKNGVEASASFCDREVRNAPVRAKTRGPAQEWYSWASKGRKDTGFAPSGGRF
jgi:hypothetical protein